MSARDIRNKHKMGIAGQNAPKMPRFLFLNNFIRYFVFLPEDRPSVLFKSSLD